MLYVYLLLWLHRLYVLVCKTNTKFQRLGQNGDIIQKTHWHKIHECLPSSIRPNVSSLLPGLRSLFTAGAALGVTGGSNTRPWDDCRILSFNSSSMCRVRTVWRRRRRC